VSNPEPLNVEVARASSKPLEELLDRALRAAHLQRGGALLTETIMAGRSINEVLVEAVSLGSLFVARDAEHPVGFALVGHGVLMSVYVDAAYRRRGVARELVGAVISSQRAVLDAFALPGDRATKSLYESFGWKARLLTMRAE
jgi:GNAT superfamily N-acetyltransferase